MRVVVTAAAEADLEGIFDYIASDSFRNAERYVRRLRTKIKSIGRSPRIHPLRDDLPFGLRSAAYGSHTIIFRIIGNTVEITNVIHGARDLRQLLKD